MIVKNENFELEISAETDVVYSVLGFNTPQLAAIRLKITAQ